MPNPARNTELAAAIARDGRFRYQISTHARMTAGVLSGIVSGRVTATPSQQRRIAGALGMFAHEVFPITDDDDDGDA